MSKRLADHSTYSTLSLACATDEVEVYTAGKGSGGISAVESKTLLTVPIQRRVSKRLGVDTWDVDAHALKRLR